MEVCICPLTVAEQQDLSMRYLPETVLRFLPSGCVPYELYVRTPEYGMADILKSQGYYTIAMHPNNGHNWNRDQVYPQMGFDEFLNQDNWGGEYQDKLRGFVSDQSVFDKIISLYKEKETNQKLFTFCVTMQNHGGYSQSTLKGYEPDVKLNYETEYPERHRRICHLPESRIKRFRIL